MTFRKIPRDVHEDARDVARAWMRKPEFGKSRNERKRIEMRFAHLKTHHRFERMRLRGLSGARDEFHLRCHCAEPQDACEPYLAATAQAIYAPRPERQLRSRPFQSGFSS